MADDEMRGRLLDGRLLARFVPLLRPYRRLALLGFALLPLISLTRAGQPLLLGLAIDRSIVPGDLAALPPLALLLLLLVVLEGALVFGQNYGVQLVGQRVMADLRRVSFARLQRLPQRWFDWQPSGRVVTRLTSDIEQVGELFGSGIVSACGDLMTLGMILAVMLRLHGPLTLLTFALVPLLVLALLLIRRPMRQLMRRLRAQTASLGAFVAERVNGMAEVQIFGQQQRSAAEFEALQQPYLTTALAWVRWETLFYASVHLFGSLTLAAIVYFGGGQVVQEQLSFGLLVAFIEYARRFFQPLTELASKFSVLQTSNAALERIFALLDEPLEPVGGTMPPAGAGVLGFEALSFSYQPQTPVLRQFDLQLAAGECVALVGDTGSGKSTLAQLLLGFYAPDEGRILLNGGDIAVMDKTALRRQIGYVAQEPFLFSGSVRQNLDPAGAAPAERLAQVLAEAGAEALVTRLGGLDAPAIGPRGRNLSSGERQLLALARALLPQPQVLVLDEATSHLDGDSEALIYRALARVARRRTTLMIVHHLRLAAQVADRIVVLHQGRLVEQGSHAELLALPGRYARLWHLQQLQQQAQQPRSAGRVTGEETL